MSKAPRVSLQTFTIRKELKNTARLRAALAKVRELGIRDLELARVPFTDEYLRAFGEAASDAGLSVFSTQMKLKEIEADPGLTAELHRILDSRYCSVSVISLEALRRGEAALDAYAERLNRLGRVLAGKGVNLLYHHHNFEFLPLPGGRTAFSILRERFDPEAVRFVFDTYWLQRSGLDPASFILQHKGLVKGVHLRDFALKGPFWGPGIRDAALGEGNLDFPGILSACAEAGVEYAAIEQNARDPWAALATSAGYLRGLGFLPAP